MDASLSLLLLVAAFSLVAEYVDSALGMGYGTTLTPVLLLLGFEPLQVVPAVLAAEFLTGIAAAALHHSFGNFHFGAGTRATGTTLLLTGSGVVGTLAGVGLAVHVPRALLGAYIGLVVAATGVLILVTRRRTVPFSWLRLALTGAVAAFNKGIGGGGYGALITGGQVLSGLDARQAIGVGSLVEGFVALVGVVLYLVLTGPMDGRLAAAVLSGALLSTPLAALTVRRLPLHKLHTVVGVAACALGILTLLEFLSP